MQITFLTMYHVFDDAEVSKALAQDDLLSKWRNCIQTNNIKFISNAHIEFKDYAFNDYPGQERLKAELTYAYKDREYKYAGIEFYNIDSLCDMLAKDKRIMELVITVENY